MPYTILIPVHNEASCIPKLLSELEVYYKEGHQILIVDDGSNDESQNLLKDSSFIDLIRLEKKSGKGYAIRKGLSMTKNNKIITFDGDLEIHPSEIKRLMVLEDYGEIKCVFGSRYEIITPLSSIWNFGNFFFTSLFNLFSQTQCTDALCGAKAFYKDDIEINKLSANRFDIDIELAISLAKKLKKIKTIYLSYDRRSENEGKKLRFSDGWTILKKILKYNF
tara:strand:- start:922 stop:1587 length:666 start_codon:yes stop_codon:yes gene_type:complete